MALRKYSPEFPSWYPTWEQLAEIEPELDNLLKEAQAVRDNGSGYYFCRDTYMVGYPVSSGLKARFSKLVGSGARPNHPLLGTSEAYDVVYHTLEAALPEDRDDHPLNKCPEIEWVW